MRSAVLCDSPVAGRVFKEAVTASNPAGRSRPAYLTIPVTFAGM